MQTVDFKINFKELPTRYVVFDYEANTDFGLDPWHPKYKLESCAFRVRDNHRVNEIYTTSVKEMKDLIEQAIEDKYLISIYNAGYEYPVTLSQFCLNLNKYGRLLDTMRLFQHSTKVNGDMRQLNLQEAARQMLGISNYKEFHLQPLLDRNIAKNMTQAHAKVSMLSSEELKNYNLDDVRITEEVMIQCWIYLANLGYNWIPDHKMYIADVMRNTKPFLEGYKFDADLAFEGLIELRKQMNELLTDFHTEYEKDIHYTVEKMKGIKTQEDFEKRKANSKTGKTQVIERDWEFKLTSTKALEALCVDTLGMEPKFFTNGGAPSFKKEFLGQWGEVGKKLKKISKLKKPIQELEKTIAMASFDGRVHTQTKAGLTATGRNTSGKGGV